MPVSQQVSQSDSQFLMFSDSQSASQSVGQSVSDVLLPVSLQVSQLLIFVLPVSQLDIETCKVLCQSASQSVFAIFCNSQSASQSDLRCQSVKKLGD